jgi:hypothetical protein
VLSGKWTDPVEDAASDAVKSVKRAVGATPAPKRRAPAKKPAAKSATAKPAATRKAGTTATKRRSSAAARKRAPAKPKTPPAS